MESEESYFARNLADPEGRKDTQGYTPLRIPRPAQKDVSSTGIDTVFVRDLPRFLLDRWRQTLKLEGPVRLSESIRHYTKHLADARGIDGRTARKLESLAETLEETPHGEQEGVFKESVEPFLKSIEMTREEETDG